MYNIKEKDRLEYFKSIVKGHTTKEIIELYYEKYGERMSEYKVHDVKKRYKLYSGVSNKFQKGNVYNKGYNKRPIGSERLDERGNVRIKIAQPNKWVRKHIYVWEQHYGKMPKGKCLIFLDGDKTNCDISNLQIVDKRVELLMARKELFYNDKELTKTGILIAQLDSKSKEIEKERERLWQNL